LAPAGTMAEFCHAADAVICLTTPEPFGSVGQYYEDFTQTSDAEVISLLNRYAPAPSIAGAQA